MPQYETLKEALKSRYRLGEVSNCYGGFYHFEMRGQSDEVVGVIYQEGGFRVYYNIYDYHFIPLELYYDDLTHKYDNSYDIVAYWVVIPNVLRRGPNRWIKRYGIDEFLEYANKKLSRIL